MALEHLIATLDGEAQAEAARILSAAKAEAAALLESAGARTAQHRAEASRVRERRLDAQVEQGLREARREARSELLEARNRVVGQVLGAAHSLLVTALDSPPYRERLEPWARQAFDCIGERQARLLCHPSLVPQLTALAANHPNLAVRPDPAIGAGFRVVAEDDAMEVDCTLEGQLAARWPVLSIEVLEAFERVE